MRADRTDVLVVGGGPSGLALAAELCRQDLTVRVVAPHPPRPFPPTYGSWLDELPAWAAQATAQVWSDVRVYTSPEPTPLLRPYALLDNAALLDTFLNRAGRNLSWTLGQVTGAHASADGWRVTGSGGEDWRTRLVVDASGHVGGLTRRANAGSPAFQTAYGLVGRFRRPPSAPGAMVWMDYRIPEGERAVAGLGPTFLYAMHLQDDVYFVEETSLIASPAPPRAALERRLHARLRSLGAAPLEVLSSEWVCFPMNVLAPPPSPVLAFGAAGGLVQPFSGFQVACALGDAPVVARAVAGSLSSGKQAAAAGWAALWPAPRRAVRDVQIVGARALLALPEAALPEFYGTFFSLPTAQWSAFLAGDARLAELARTMLQIFLASSPQVRLPLAAAALRDSRASLSALRAALTNVQFIG